jgi:hypothetical protein
MRSSAYAAVFLGLVTAAIWLVTSEEAGGAYSAILLAVAPVLLLIGMRLRNPPRAWIGITCLFLEALKAVLLFYYARADQHIEMAEWLSLAALAITGTMLLVVLVLARITMDKTDAQNAIRRHSFAAICAAFYLFAHVTSNLTFALALHDRRGPGTALIATQGSLDAKQFTFAFAEGGTSIDTAASLASLIKDDEWPESNMEQREMIAGRYDSKTVDDLEDLRHNVEEWKNLGTTINNPKVKWWRITIVGHASDALAAVDGAKKNQALSELRTRQMYESLRRMLGDARVEWVLRAISNDDAISARRFRDGRNHKLHVEVSVEKQRPLSLLDYSYFMIYTITTTGYGDFVPATPRAKFISSVANIFELLFIVVLLNLVIVYGTRPPENASTTSSSTVPPPQESSGAKN